MPVQKCVAFNQEIKNYNNVGQHGNWTSIGSWKYSDNK